MAEPPSAFIRRAKPDEYAKAGDLTVEVYLDGGFVSPASPYMATLRDAADRAAKAELLVAEVAEELVGAVAYCPPGSPYSELAQGPDEAEIRMLAVSERARGKGVAQALMDACLDRARASGLSRVRLATEPNMRAARHMYERMGFRRTPQRDYAPLPGMFLLAYELALGPRRMERGLRRRGREVCLRCLAERFMVVQASVTAMASTSMRYSGLDRVWMPMRASAGL